MSNPPTYVDEGTTVSIRVMKGAGESEEGVKRLAIRLANTYAALAEGQSSPAHKLVINAGLLTLSDSQMTIIARQYAKTILALSTADKLKQWLTEPMFNKLAAATKTDPATAKTGPAALIDVKADSYAGYKVQWTYPENPTCDPPAGLHVNEDCCSCWKHYWVDGQAMKAGSPHFEIRRGNAYFDGLQQQLNGSLGAVPIPPGVTFDQPLALAKKYKPLAERTNKLLKAIESAYLTNQARKDSLDKLLELTQKISKESKTPGAILVADEAVVAELHTLNNLGLQTPEMTRWLLSTFWIKSGKSLTATPTYGLSTDSLLYQGLLKVSAPTGRHKKSRVKMRHHDASRNYTLTNAREGGQINETQEMALLVHNITSKNKPAIGTVTFKPIANDMDLLSETFKGGEGTPLGENPTKREISIYEADALARKFLDEYVTLVNRLAPFAQWKDQMNAPARMDTTATYHTEELAYQHPTPDKAPATITYELKDGTTTITGVAGYDYRYAKLYRFRFKAGLMYSTLVRSKYTIDAATNVARRTDTPEGQVAAFGLQYFPSRIDIKDPTFWPTGNGFFYLGFTLTDKLAKNWLIGAGAEVYSGVALLGGIHVSQTQRLQVSNGVLSTTEDLWRRGYFIQLALGLEAFNKLFGASDIKKPF